MIFLVITAAVGNAMATFLVRVASFFQPRPTVSSTASRLAMLPSTTASLGRGSITYRSTRMAPLPASTSSTILIEDELMSIPNKGWAFGLKMSKSSAKPNFPF